MDINAISIEKTAKYSLDSYALTTMNCFYIAKALKVKHNIPITKTLANVNLNEFYEGLNNNINCNGKILEDILSLTTMLKENIDKLIIEGKNIINEELLFKKINWSDVISNLKYTFNIKNKDLGKHIGCNYKNFSYWEIGIKNPNYNNSKLILGFIDKNGLNLYDLSKPSIKKYTYKDKYGEVESINITPEFSEFIGIVNGDGSITKGGMIRITGNGVEDLMHHKIRITSLVKKLFNKDINKKLINSVVASTLTSRYLSKQLENIGLPMGKKDNLRIPKIILYDNNLLKPYLRGLFDTDGTICRRNKFNARIGYGSFKGETLTRDVFSGLKKIGFNPKYSLHKDRSRVEIINDLDVVRFFEKVGSCNYSKICRFIYWRLNNICPSYDYDTFVSKLKEQSIEIEMITVPFFWNKEYISSLNIKLRSVLIPRLEEDKRRYKVSKIRKLVNWKERTSFLKDKFNLKTLTKELHCNYKTIWQWETGARIPSLGMCMQINMFCNKNNIKLL